MARGWEDEGGAVYMSCSRDHGSNVLVRTSQGGAFCLECFTHLIASPASLVVHKEKALSEFTEALTDPEFCGDLILKRPEFLAAPLAEAIFFTDDEGVAYVIIDVLVTTCKLAVDTLLQDAMLHICSHLDISKSESIPSKRGNLFNVHALGLLLELHSLHSNLIPFAITSQANCIQSLVSAISLPTDEMGVDVFFIFAKLTTLEGGIHLLAEYCPSLVYLALRALQRTESDDIRTNSLDMLIALAQASVFNICLSKTAAQEQIVISDQGMTSPSGQTGATFVKQFADAMKASLLSTDIHVQIKSLVLIDQVCPKDMDIDEELHSLVKDGVTDYIFEVLRTSGDLGAVATSAVQTLTTLSLATPTFSDHFSLGLEPLLCVLEYSFTSAFGDLQKDILIILAAGIADRPGVISCARAQHLVNLLRKSFQRYRGILKDHEISNILGFGLSPEGLNATCGTLITLLRAPSCCNIPSICPMLQECVSALTDCISADPNYAIHHNGLTYAAHLLHEAHLFCVQQNFAYEQFNDLAQFLMTHFHMRMLPVIKATWESISDEETLISLFCTVKNIVQDGAAIKAGEFARILISKHWVSMAFEIMSKSPSEDLKQNVYCAIGTMINKISSNGELIQDDVLHYLPLDVEGLLMLLEQRSHEDFRLIAAQRAIITILFTAVEHDDRLVESNRLLSSLEQYLLVNASSLASPDSPVLKQFLHLFIEGQDNITSQSRFRSLKAENIMLDILQAAHNSGCFEYELPVRSLKWIMKRESLTAISIDLLFKFLDAGADGQATVTQLIHEDDHVTELISSLFLNVVEKHLADEIRIVATGLSSIIRGDWSFPKKFHSHGIVSTLRRFIILQGCKAPQATVTSCLELLFQVLVVLDESMAVMDEDAWLDIAIQTEKLSLMHMNNRSIYTSDVGPFVNLLALIMHKSIRIRTLQEAASKAYMSIELRDAFEMNIVNASQKGSALTVMDINSEDGMSLRASLLFHVLWLRCMCNITHEAEYDKTDSEDISERLTTRVSFQILCQLLCFSTHSIQILTSSCLVEHLSHIMDNDGKLQGKFAECTIAHLGSATLLLQGAAIASAGLLRKNACICMMRLLGTSAPDPKQKEAITRSPWYKTVAEELLLTLVQNGAEDHNSASFLSALLCISPPYKWLPSVFNSQVLTAAIDSFKTTQNITIGTINLFLELLKKGFLTYEQVEVLRDSYQAVRRKCYRGSTTIAHTKRILAPEMESTSLVDTICSLEGKMANMDNYTLIMHLALNDTKEQYLGLRDDAQIAELDKNSLLLIKIDEFLQRSVERRTAS